MKLYLAGPDVFRPDADRWAEEARQLCLAAGHHPLLPVDGLETTAAGIFSANIALIGAADAVVANLNPFRGCEPDSGTCMEVGYALALGKRVVAYVTRRETTVERARRLIGELRPVTKGGTVDGDGWLVEDFGLPLNLMLAVPATVVVGGLPEALAVLG